MRHDFEVDGANAVVVEPNLPLPHMPGPGGVVLRGLPDADIVTEKRGWHLAYIGVPDRFGLTDGHEALEKVLRCVGPRGAGFRQSPPDRTHRTYPLLPGLGGDPSDDTLLVLLDNGVCDFKSSQSKGLGARQGAARK